jgi:hypothetical protein
MPAKVAHNPGEKRIDGQRHGMCSTAGPAAWSA